MIHELRRYRVKTGMTSEYLAAFEQIALPVIQRHMKLLAFWTSEIGELGCVYHLWEFEDHRHRAECYAAMRADAKYRDEFMPIALPLIEEMHSTILTPTEFSKNLALLKGR